MIAADQKLYVRGVTYGTFRGSDGDGYPEPSAVARDFAAMAAAGFNAVRLYTVPPAWLLDAAAEAGLRVMVGLAWEQHVTFLDDRRRVRSIEERVREGVRRCQGHPALLCYAVGNEIPAQIVRWHGRRRIERFLERIARAAKDEDPEGLVTYVNYPSTEYLDLPFADLWCFNVFLEQRERFEAYLARLHNLAGDRPLILSEVGLDSARNGERAQAAALESQLGAVFATGCAGAFVFAWTDEWHRGGEDIEDWSFGIVDRERRPKPALSAVSRVLAEVPFAGGLPWPRVSVVVCTHNGAGTLADCLGGLGRLDYPDYEVIVVDDGSTDATAEVAARFPVSLVRTENRGLSCARNTGLELARGEIVAYIDDDARPDPQWLKYLAHTFLTTPHPATGGPNVAPRSGGVIARSVEQAPGGPIHVLISDLQAEHVPGCNMAFRTAALRAIGGFDPRFTAAGDDVDICWRLQATGQKIAFTPAAMVWHRRRGSIIAYARQQFGYGKAEALLERKWPERYNRGGHARWSGHVYGRPSPGLLRSRRVHYGVWGGGLFQSLYQRTTGTFTALPLMPEWYLLLAALAVATGYDLIRRQPLVSMPFLHAPLAAVLLVTCVAAVTFQAVFAAAASTRPGTPARLRTIGVTALIHLLQPVARLAGRLTHGLTPWRRHGRALLGVPRVWTFGMWSETWLGLEERLERLESSLRSVGVPACRGGAFDRWDVEVRGGWLGGTRVRATVEEHGRGRQLVRFRSWPRCAPGALAAIAGAILLAPAAAVAGAGPATIALVLAALLLAARAVRDCVAATVAVRLAVEAQLQGEATATLLARTGHPGPAPPEVLGAGNGAPAGAIAVSRVASRQAEERVP